MAFKSKYTSSQVETLLNKVNAVSGPLAGLISPNFTGAPTAPTVSSLDSSTSIATTAMVQAAINYKLSEVGALIFKGTIGNPPADYQSLPNPHTLGWTFIVANEGTYSGHKCEPGDLICCRQAGNVENSTDWTVVQVNIDGAVVGPSQSIDSEIVLFSGTTGKIIKGSGQKLSDYVLKTTTVNGHALSSNIVIDKSDIGLSNVDNTSDVDKPVSSAQKLYIDGQISTTVGKIPTKLSQLTNDAGFITSASIPTKLPNPQLLKWTGYTQGSYDGSIESVINIPSKMSELVADIEYSRLWNIGEKVDFESVVILLWRDDLDDIHRLTGKVFTEQRGGDRFQSANVDLWFSRWSASGYDMSYYMSWIGLGDTMNLVTFNYQGAKWWGLQHTNIQACKFFFQGTKETINLSVIVYRNINGVVNTEIDNSIENKNSLVQIPIIRNTRFAILPDLPTKLSQLTNDVGYLTSVSWSQVQGRPTNLSDFSNDVGYITSSGSCAYATNAGTANTATSAQTIPWTGVSGKPDKLSQFSNDVGYLTSASLPTKLSEFSNDVGYITSSGSCAYATNAGSAQSVPWLGVTDRPTDLSSFTNNAGYTPLYTYDLGGATINNFETILLTSIQGNLYIVQLERVDGFGELLTHVVYEDLMGVQFRVLVISGTGQPVTNYIVYGRRNSGGGLTARKINMDGVFQVRSILAFNTVGIIG